MRTFVYYDNQRPRKPGFQGLGIEFAPNGDLHIHTETDNPALLAERIAWLGEFIVSDENLPGILADVSGSRACTDITPLPKEPDWCAYDEITGVNG